MEKKKALTVKLKESDYKKLVTICRIENDDISHQDFIENAILYAMKNGIVPEEK
ncbi:MAG: hypothetical protein GY754_24590 [bacterium]|nr:hypothetical protein [bacterium]